MPQGFWGSDQWGSFDWSTNVQLGEAAVEFSFTETASLTRVHIVSAVLEAELQPLANPYDPGSWNEDNWDQYNWNKGPVFVEGRGIRVSLSTSATLERVGEASCTSEFTLSIYDLILGNYAIEALGEITIEAFGDASVTDTSSSAVMTATLAYTDQVNVTRIIRSDSSCAFEVGVADLAQDHNSYVAVIEVGIESTIVGNGTMSMQVNESSFAEISASILASGSYGLKADVGLEFIEENEPGGSFQISMFDVLLFGTNYEASLSADMAIDASGLTVTLDSPSTSASRVAVVFSATEVLTLSEGELLLIQNLLTELTATVEQYAKGRRLTKPMQIDYFQIKQTAIQEILAKIKKTALAGVVDGSNTVFTTPTNYTTVLDVQVDGVSVDFSETDDDEVTLTVPPASLSVVKALWVEV